MDITTIIVGFVALAAVAVVALVLGALRRRTLAKRVAVRPSLQRPRGSRSFTDWFAGDPVLFVGGDVTLADCTAGGDGGSGCP